MILEEKCNARGIDKFSESVYPSLQSLLIQINASLPHLFSIVYHMIPYECDAQGIDTTPPSWIRCTVCLPLR